MGIVENGNSLLQTEMRERETRERCTVRGYSKKTTSLKQRGSLTSNPSLQNCEKCYVLF